MDQVDQADQVVLVVTTVIMDQADQVDQVDQADQVVLVVTTVIMDQADQVDQVVLVVTVVHQELQAPQVTLLDHKDHKADKGL